jgi:hypothetical protein
METTPVAVTVLAYARTAPSTSMSHLVTLGKKMRYITLLLVATLAGCTSRLDRGPFKPDGHLLFSMRVVGGAFSGPEKNLTGSFFYIGDPEPNVSGPIITAYVLRKGVVVDTIYAGSYESVLLREEIERIGFEPFDIETEIKRVDAERKAEAERTGTMILGVTTLDGAEYELRFVFSGTDFSLRRWNPGPEIDFYADFSPKIRKLKEVLDAFARYYGRRKFDA